MKKELSAGAVLHRAFIISLGLFGAFFIQSGSVQAARGSLDASSIIALTNQDRERGGATALTRDSALSAIAQKRATEMLQGGYFSHISPDGRTPWSWLIAGKYYYTRAGENLAEDFNDAKSVEQAWMRSPGHRANILDSSYTRIGVGVAHGFKDGKPTALVVEFFATPYTTPASAVMLAASGKTGTRGN